MAKKKLNLKGLILFCVGFVVFSAAALGVGFFVLPMFLEPSDQPAVVVEELPKVEESTEQESEKKEPNTFFSAQKGEVSVQCDGTDKAEGARVGLFVETTSKCTVLSGTSQAEITAEQGAEYICFASSFSSCRTIEEQKEVEKKEAEEKALAEKQQSVKNQSKSTPKVTSGGSSRLKNEAEVIVTGPATMTISADIDAVIFVDGKKIRKAPLFKYEVSSGSHKVIIVDEKDFSRRKEFSIDTESGMNYIRQWSFQDNTWLKKIP